MKNVKAMFGTITLGLLLSSVALAGDVSTPGYVPPPPPPAAAPLQETGDSDISSSSLAIDSSSLAIDLLIAALGAFY
ncbi:MAG TPA: hypothetical protein VFV61_06045 [Pyrinomonadaceae bacterium]|nr:hypothetical protein [Pyrinomonadaceae bacterium]